MLDAQFQGVLLSVFFYSAIRMCSETFEVLMQVLRPRQKLGDCFCTQLNYCVSYYPVPTLLFSEVRVRFLTGTS